MQVLEVQEEVKRDLTRVVDLLLDQVVPETEEESLPKGQVVDEDLTHPVPSRTES